MRVEGARQVVLPLPAAARCEFPLRLGRQIVPLPARVSERIFVCDVHDGMVLLFSDGAARTRRAAPTRTFDILPPLGELAVISVARWNEHDRARRLQLLRQTWVGLWVKPAFRQASITGCRDECAELSIRDLVPVDPEAIEPHEMREALFGPLPPRAHCEGTGGDERHAPGLLIALRQAGI